VRHQSNNIWSAAALRPAVFAPSATAKSVRWKFAPQKAAMRKTAGL
jgi:hypothetical protein